MVTEQGRGGEREERMICTGSRLGERRGGESLPHARARPHTRPHPPPPPPPPPRPAPTGAGHEHVPSRGRGAVRAVREPRAAVATTDPLHTDIPAAAGGGA